MSTCGSTRSTIRCGTCAAARSTSRVGCPTAATRRSSSTSNTRARRTRRSTSRCAASARCGTSSPASTAGRSPPTCSARRSVSGCPADGAPRRTARRGVGPVVRHGRPPAALLHDPRAASRAARPAAGDGAARHHRQQHRPQERSLPARRRPTDRHRCGASTRAVLRAGVQAAHGDLGVRRRADPRRRCSSRSSQVVRAGSARDRRAARATPRSKRSRAAPRGASRSGCSRPTRPAAATPGRWSRAARTRPLGERRTDDALDGLIHRADLDGLVRMIDDRCSTRDWAGCCGCATGPATRSRPGASSGRRPRWPSIAWPCSLRREFVAAVLDERTDCRAGSRSAR